MGLSKTWDNDILNDFNSSRSLQSIFNDGVMCIYESKHDGKVNRCIAIYAKKHTRKEALLYNNRLYLSSARQQRNKEQYEANRKYILSLKFKD